jgi:hypothetical protein
MNSTGKASPTACIIDSQSVKSVKKGAHIDPSGYDARKKIKGKKRRRRDSCSGDPV